ncbi:MAG: CHAP domain-containing protein [Deltaproteobacteria bacterium]|nr:CHAP domain-containing protein [Deltaproteobacteria bacterium]
MTRASLAAGLALAILAQAKPAAAAYECGGEYDTCTCGRDNYCLCDGTCGNCVWHAWHSACCHWGRALEWCTDANTWNDNAAGRGYPTGSTPADGSIFVCEPSGTCSTWGHVGWVVTAHADGSFDSTEQFWGGPCGTHSRTRSAGFATGGFIYNPSGPPPPPTNDDADFVSETIPDGTHFRPGEAFVKRWTMRNAGDTTWTRGDNYLWAFDGDERFGAAEQTLLPDGASVAPGSTRDWDVPMTAPSSPGTYRGYWRMDRFGTHRFGDRVWVEIVVDDVAPADGDGDGYAAGTDCDDGNADVHPGAAEVCNGRDDDCEGGTDEGVTNRCGGCGPEPAEACDGLDNDCDGATDEDCSGDGGTPDAGPPDGADAATDGVPGDGAADAPDTPRSDVPRLDAAAEGGDAAHPVSGGDAGCGGSAAGRGRSLWTAALLAAAFVVRRRRS